MFVLQALLVISAASADGPTTLVQFTADWCAPCKSMEPTVKRLAQQKYPVLVVNIDQRKDLADRFGVREIPCFVMLVNGREVDRATGVVSYDRFVQMYRRAGQSTQGSSQPLQQRSAIAQSAPSSYSQNQPRSAPIARAHSGNQIPIRPVGNQYSSQQYGQVSSSQVSGNRDPNRQLTPQQRAMYATVRLKVADARGQSYGTGTVIDVHGNEALVLTCAHIFRDSNGRGITADLYTPGAGKQRPGQLIAMDMNKDIALVSVQAAGPVIAAEVATELAILQPGRSVFSVGCNRGADPTLERGQIKSVDRYLGPPNIEVSGQPEIGRSGGGLFATDGKLIGVCNAADEIDNEGIYASLPIVHWQLAQVGMQRLYQKQAPTISNPINRGQMLANNQQTRQPQPIHHVPTTPAHLSGNRNATMVPVSPARQTLSESAAIESGTLQELLSLLAQNPNSTVVNYRNSRGQLVTLDRESVYAEGVAARAWGQFAEPQRGRTPP